MTTSNEATLLTPERVAAFHENGYLVIEDFATPEEVASLGARGVELVEAADPESISVFSTVNQTLRTDRLFLDSASRVEIFFEEKAFDDRGRLAKPKQLAANKIGHALHDLDPVVGPFSRSPRVKALLRALGYRRPLPVQSMYIFKQPGIGGEVVPHQDSSFLATDPPSVVGLWLALEDAGVENSCLWALPGSHRHPIARRFVRAADDSVSFDAPQPEYDFPGHFVPLEVGAGTLVVLHGALVHASTENRSDKSRHAYAMHVVEGARSHRWRPDNWLRRPDSLPFVPLYDEDA